MQLRPPPQPLAPSPPSPAVPPPLPSSGSLATRVVLSGTVVFDAAELASLPGNFQATFVAAVALAALVPRPSVVVGCPREFQEGEEG
jgi:hypothetical protein